MSNSYLTANEVKTKFFKSHKEISLSGDGYIYDLVIDDDYIMSLLPDSETKDITNITLNLYNIKCKNLTIDFRSKYIKTLSLYIIDTYSTNLVANNKHGSLEVGYIRSHIKCANVKSTTMQLVFSSILQYNNIESIIENIVISERSNIYSLSFNITSNIIIYKNSTVSNLRGYVKNGKGTAETALQSKYGLNTQIKRNESVYHDIEYFNDKALSYVISHMV